MVDTAGCTIRWILIKALEGEKIRDWHAYSVFPVLDIFQHHIFINLLWLTGSSPERNKAKTGWTSKPARFSFDSGFTFLAFEGFTKPIAESQAYLLCIKNKVVIYLCILNIDITAGLIGMKNIST